MAVPYFGPPFYPSDGELAVTQMMMKANCCPYIPSKIELYSTAAAMCRQNGMHQTEAIIHCKLFQISFHKLNQPYLALEHAKRAVRADPNYGEGYNCQAQVFQCFGIALQRSSPSEAKSAFSKAIDDYQKSYFLSRKYDHTAACQAIIVAFEQGMTDKLLGLQVNLDHYECTDLVVFMASSDLSWKCKHIHFLVVRNEVPGSGIAATLSCDLSQFPWKYLLQKDDLNLETVQGVVSLNGKLTPQDVVYHANDSYTSVLQFAIANCAKRMDDATLIKLCEHSIKSRKINFTKELIINSIPSGNSKKLVELALKSNSLELVEVMISQNFEIDPALIVSKMRKQDLQSRRNLNSFIMSTPKGCAHLLYKSLEYLELGAAEKCLSIEDSEALKNEIDLSVILSSHQGSKDDRLKRLEFIEKLLTFGCDPNGLPEKPCPLDVVLELSKEYQDEKEKLLVILLKHGAAIQRCTYPRRKETTLIHEATKFVIDSGETLLLEEVCSYFPFEDYSDGKVQDNQGNTPYHLVMDRKKSPTTIQICEILSRYPINPSLSNSHGKRPGEKRTKEQQEKKDKRYIIMQEAAKNFQVAKKKGRKKKNKPSSVSAASPKESDHSVEAPSPFKNVQQPEMPAKNTDEVIDIEDMGHDISEMLKALSRKPQSYFVPPPNYVRQKSNPQKAAPSFSENVDEPEVSKGESLTTLATENGASNSEVDTNITDISSNFGDSTWEIECTDKVKKFFANTKIQRSEKEKVVKALMKIVNGIPMNNQKICKEVRSGSKLYESRYTKGSRIIFEIAIQFSPRLTEKSEKSVYVYTEVIRLWDIVRHHDELNRSIGHVHDCIMKSQSRGREAAIRTPLKFNSDYKPTKRSTQGQEKLRLPQCYVCSEPSDTQASSAAPVVFTPAGSTKDDEYNVITFYSFDSSFVRSMLDGENARRDFPFKEWPKEHDIINMPQGKKSILLLGRSGTGKTTCCLYRIWNQFQTYWTQVSLANFEPCFPQRPLAILRSEETEDSDDSDSNNSLEDEDSDATAPVPSEDEPHNAVQMQHFHQVFITKNYVLCAQMKKRFYDLAAGSKVAEKHMDYEDAEIPSNFSAIEDRAYPLFLTARQFFILLDNSLQDGKAFFPRDPEGKLAEKIVSADYDHEDPDTLLDLEESDSEDEDDGDSDFDEDDFKPQPVTEKKRLPQRREITASYFAEKIWPKISKNVSLKDTKIDPLLVWMEIKSFIKGSMRAVGEKYGYLSQEDYESLGKKMAPNYAEKRSDIYSIFKQYQNYMKHHSEESVFDECDLNHSIYTRLNALKDLPWSIHSIYIDEVQDFTQAELSILIRICREPNDLFLTGDTAQSIMRGIAFRFGDLKSIFYRASKQASTSAKALPVKVPKVNELTINFRSHTGVLQLAASVIDLMKHFFPNSFDCLPGDEGMFPGPIPIVLDSCNVSDLALVMRSNKRESSTIEFGAHQVIIVQSEEAKKNLPDVLKAGIVLTVFEAKGLEFDDVLLYNFFKESKVENDWRVVASFTEDNSELWKAASSANTFAEKPPRRLEFNEGQHKSLNAELKYLYTAITRAKCNLWIYDSDQGKRLPMFDYWSKRGLVKVIRVDDITEEDQSTLFSATSSAEEWKSQGDYFKKKRLWEPAMKCYERANCPHLESEARAYSLAQQARTPGLKRTEINEIYVKAAHAFLKCDQVQHNYQCLENAAKCFKNAKKYRESSQLYVHLGQNEKALKGYRRARDAEGLAKIKEKMGDYDGAIRLLLKHNRITEALKHAARYENMRKVTISECYRVHYLANRYAEKLSTPALHTNPTNLRQFEIVVGYLKPHESVNFYKAADMHEKACEVLKNEGKYSDLFRIYKAQGWNEEGIQLAKSDRRFREDEAIFILFKATAELAETPSKLQEGTVAMLKRKVDTQSEIGAKTSLIFGIGTESSAKIKMARDFYTNRKPHNSFGQIEAFKAAIAGVKYDHSSKTWKNIHLGKNEDFLTLALTICREIKNVISALDITKEPSAAQRQVTTQLENFYGLEKRKVGEYQYFVPASSYPWTNQLLRKLEVNKEVRDADGMLQLEIETVYEGVCAHLEEYIHEWIVEDHLHIVEHFNDLYAAHPLHKHIAKGGYLHQSFLINSSKIAQQHGYFRLLCIAYELAHYGSPSIASKQHWFKAVVEAISPQATCYFPVSSSSLQIQSSVLIQALNEKVFDTLAKQDQAFRLDEWMNAWRINCVTKKGSNRMKDILIQRSTVHNQSQKKKVDSEGYQQVHKRQKSQDTAHQHIPPAYVLNRNDQYQHLMLLWLRTCELFQEKGTLASSTIAVYSIFQHIATQSSIWRTVSVSNLLNMVTIHTVAILTMRAACSVRFQNAGMIFLPLSYKNVVEVFHTMNGPSNMDFHRSCIHYIMNRKNLPEVPPKLEKMLKIILKVMIGIHNKNFNPLKHALSREDCLKNGEARHCIVFVFTLFCNIGLINISPAELQAYRRQIYESIKSCKNSTLINSCSRFLNSRTLLGCFGATRELLELANDTLQQASMSFNNLLMDIEIEFKTASLNTPFILNQPQLIPLPFQLPMQLSKPVAIKSSLRPEAAPFNPTTSASLNAQASEFIPEKPQANSGLEGDTTTDASTSNPALDEASLPEPLPLLDFEAQPELQTMDSIEAEDDPETRAALTIEPEEIPVMQESDILRESTIDYTFCPICVCLLEGSSATESNDPNLPTESAETIFKKHCRTEGHITKEELKKQFELEEKDYYIPTRESILELTTKCSSLYRFRQDNKLQIIEEEAKTSIKEMDTYLQKIRDSAEWRDGVYKLRNDYTEQLQFVQMRITRLIEEAEEVQRKIERDEAQQERKDEEESLDDAEPEEDDIIVQTNYGSKGKEKRRKQKREKKRRK